MDDKDTSNSPKTKKIANNKIMKNKKLKKNNSDDNEGDSDNEMNRKELQKFIQKIFPSKSNAEKIRQMEKIDEMMDKKEKKNKKCKSKKSHKKKSKKKNSQKKNKTECEEKENESEQESQHEEVESDNQEDEDTSSDYIPEEDSEFEDDEDEYLDEYMDDYEDRYDYYENDEDYMDDDYEQLLKNNMKFNIIFTVGKNGDEYDDDMFQYEDDYVEEETEEEEEEKVSKSKNKKNKSEKKKTKKKERITVGDMDDKTYNRKLEKALLEEESKLKKTSKQKDYKLKDRVMVKQPEWDDYYKGTIIKINKKKKSGRNLISYNIELDSTDDEEYETLKNIKSKYIKPLDKENEEEEDILEDIKEFIKIKKKKGKKGLFEKLNKVIKKEEEKKKEKKDAKTKKLKNKNVTTLRKLLRQKSVMNDFKYFREMDLDSQKKILKQLKMVNKFSNVEKPYKISLLESNIPMEFKANALKKINTLNYMDPGSGEYYKIKQWVDTFMRIPFGVTKHLPINMNDGIEKCNEFMENAKNILDNSVYGLEDAKIQIMQMLGQWISNPDAVGTAIAIKGPMGTGKTTLVKEGISKILNRPFAFIALGGATDSSFLEGHSYTYEGSMWGKIVDVLINKKCMNPVFYFDELDKVSNTPKGEEIIGILTHLTDTTQNSEFHDKYFANVNFNLSKALFIFSYNEEEKVNPILKDRMYRIQTKGYNKKEKCIIAKKYLIPSIEKNVNFEKDQIVIEDEIIEYICDNSIEKEDGVRNLKRALEIIYTKINLHRLMKEGSQLFNKEESIKITFPFVVTKEVVNKLIKKSETNSVPFGMYV